MAQRGREWNCPKGCGEIGAPSVCLRCSRLLEREEAQKKKKNPLPGDIVTDGAGVKWACDDNSGWWYWLAQDGTWQGSVRTWTPLPKKTEASLLNKSEAKRGVAWSDDVSDAASNSAASSVSTAAPAPPGALDKGERRRAARTAKRAAAKGPASTIPGPQDTEAQVKVHSCKVAVPAPAPAPSAINFEGQSLSHMVETIRGELGLDSALTMVQVIAQANQQLEKPAEGNLATQAKSLLREIIQA